MVEGSGFVQAGTGEHVIQYACGMLSEGQLQSPLKTTRDNVRIQVMQSIAHLIEAPLKVWWTK